MVVAAITILKGGMILEVFEFEFGFGSMLSMICESIAMAKGMAKNPLLFRRSPYRLYRQQPK